MNAAFDAALAASNQRHQLLTTTLIQAPIDHNLLDLVEVGSKVSLGA